MMLITDLDQMVFKKSSTILSLKNANGTTFVHINHRGFPILKVMKIAKTSIILMKKSLSNQLKTERRRKITGKIFSLWDTLLKRMLKSKKPTLLRHLMNLCNLILILLNHIPSNNIKELHQT